MFKLVCEGTQSVLGTEFNQYQNICDSSENVLYNTLDLITVLTAFQSRSDMFWFSCVRLNSSILWAKLRMQYLTAIG